MPKTRILVVDDAVVMRKLITETLRQDPDLEVVGVAVVAVGVVVVVVSCA